MPRIQGRKVYPSDLQERRIIAQLGGKQGYIKVPRNSNPFIIARRLHRAAHQNPDLLVLKSLVEGKEMTHDAAAAAA